MKFSENNIKDLGKNQKESFEQKKDDLKLVNEILQDKFGLENLPKNLVLDMINIRNDIKHEIDKNNFAEDLNTEINKSILLLTAEVVNSEFNKENIDNITEVKDGVEIIFKDGHKEHLDEDDKELLSSLKSYFDTYRLAINGNKFRSNLEEIKSGLVKESNNRITNFHTKDDAPNELILRLKDKYVGVGFSESEIEELVKTCDLKDLDALPIHKIKEINKIREIFSRFMGGDKSKYFGLSVALIVPAIIDGYTPKLFSDAFTKDTNTVNTITHLVLYALASGGSYLTSAFIEKKYNDLANKNFKKEGGIGEYSANNITEMPPSEISKFGIEGVKQNTYNGRSGYNRLLDSISFNIIPTTVTLITSVAVLIEKSPTLAASTGLATGISIALNKYIEKKGKFWDKMSKEKQIYKQTGKKINESLSAHMDIILAGEKEKFTKDIRKLVEEEKVARGSREYLQKLLSNFNGLSHVINLTLSGAASVIGGVSADKMFAAMMYSSSFSNGIQNLQRGLRDRLESLKDMVRMEIMFNGSAEEEKNSEKKRIGINEINNCDIDIKNVNVSLDDKKILDDINLNIPAGSMANIEGSSGSGKTTLMKIISGYYKPDSGEVKLGGYDVNSIKKAGEESIYNKLAYLSQFPYLFEDTLKNNLKFGIKKEVDDEKIKEVLKDVGLYQRFGKNLEEKIYGGAGDSGNTSGGETSRVGLARVLLKIRNSDAKLVFLDEPTASVDKQTVIDIANVINAEKLKKPDTTFIVISHDEKFVDMLNCNVKVRMEKGKIVNE